MTELPQHPDRPLTPPPDPAPGVDAMAVLQKFLDETSRAVLDGDWETYRRRVILPFTLVTRTATMVVEDEDRLRMGFESFNQMLSLQRATHYICRTETATMLDPNLIAGGYSTHIFSGGLLIVPAFRSQVTLQLRDGMWRAATISNALVNERWPVLVPKPDPSGDMPEAGR